MEPCFYNFFCEKKNGSIDGAMFIQNFAGNKFYNNMAPSMEPCFLEFWSGKFKERGSIDEAMFF